MERMNASGDTFDFDAGDHVALIDDDWSGVGHDIVVLEREPVPGSTQCVIQADGDIRTVSRHDLRPIR